MKITRILILLIPVVAIPISAAAYSGSASSSLSATKPESLGLYDLSSAVDERYSSKNTERLGFGFDSRSAYDVVIRGDAGASKSLTYLNQSGAFGVGAEYAPDETEEGGGTVGFLVNAQQGPYEAAVAYHQSSEDNGAIKGRLTYKSRNSSKVQLDLVAEKYVASLSRPETADATLSKPGDSMSFLVGAKYQLSPKAYVSGQYGAVGFASSESQGAAERQSGRDYWALSLEAGYKLNDFSVIYLSHARKKINETAEPNEGSNDLLASQLNSIGVQLNW